MPSLYGIFFHIWLLLAPHGMPWVGQYISFPFTAAGGGGGTISLKHQVTVDGGTTATPAAIDVGGAAAGGEAEIVAIATAGTTITSVKDCASSGACGTALSSWTIMTQTSGTAANVTFAYTCNAVATSRWITVVLGSSKDEVISVWQVGHTVTSSCQDKSATTSVASGATLTTSPAYTTSVANEFALALMADDANCGPSWTGTAGSGFTLGTAASACASMLGAPEYQIYTTTQTSVNATLTTGNSSGNPMVMQVVTFE